MKRNSLDRVSHQTALTVGIILLLMLISEPLLAATSSPSAVADALGQGWIYGLFFVFILGLLLNLTPCVYPMIPITVGYFGSRRSNHWSSRLLSGLIYLSGMVLIYTMLGAMAALTGQMLGQALQSPIIQGLLAFVMVLMAAAMFGFFQLHFGADIEDRLRKWAEGLGTFGMGMVLGVAAAPCLAPSTVALLSYVGNQGNIVVGSLLFLVLSLGLGLPYVFLAVFTGLLDHLPESGRWFEWIEKLIGYLLAGVSLYFLWPLLSPELFGWLVVGWLVVSGVGLSVSVLPRNRYWLILRTLAVLLVAGSGIYWTLYNVVWLEQKLDWTPGTEFVANVTYDRPTMVYTSADWCVPCQEMKVTTFQSRSVLRAAQGVKLVKIDLSKPPPQPVAEWMEQYDLVGVPTTLFFDAKGNERQSLRGQGYLSSRDLAERLRRIKNQSGSSYF
jgi:thiol:disulfide interchange protein DsbD